ncbi:OmpH family outer membrane protein [Chryseobacterium kwangjuense]|uniref:OmpH family outer membrane protein n=1 Tax=Chryseobacterium kwangjuense TaxID=267125 RepID=A0ABW9K7J5_9FLAO
MKIIVLFFIFFANILNAQNIAFANRAKILKSVPKYEESLKSIEDQNKKYSEEIKSLQTKLKENLDQITKGYSTEGISDINQLKSILKDSDSLKFNLILQEKEFVEKKQEAYNNLLQSDYNRTIVPILDKVDGIISSFAIRKKYIAIYDFGKTSGDLIYLDKSKDVTKEIIAEVKTNFK